MGAASGLLPASAQTPLPSPAAPLADGDTIAGGGGSVSPAKPLLLAPAAGGAWNLSNRAVLTVTLSNPTKSPITVLVRAENADANGLTDTVRTATRIAPGKTETVTLRLVRRPQDPTYVPLAPYFMYFKNVNVRDNTVDPAAVVRVVVTLDANTPPDASVTVGEIKAVGKGLAQAPPFFPFVDKFGQYVHSDWPGKIYDAKDFPARIKEEEDEMRAYPGPEGWDKWGGWAAGPKLNAAGHFTTAKYEGKWSLVDPDGHLFFSYGPTGVGFGEGTPVTSRENWFTDLPPQTNAPLSAYWGTGKGATYMYYKDKPYQTFDFSGAAAQMKYGPNWRVASLDRLHKRMRNWGFNTLANWSSWDVEAVRKTPYCVAIHYGGPKIYRMPDAFDPAFETALQERLQAEKGKSADDPWCIGYFVDNELWWGPGQKADNVAHSVIQAAPGSASKQVFLADLQAKYNAIEKLNAVWGTDYASWDALRQSQKLPADLKKIAEDCGAFGLKFANHYFETVRKAVKSAAPNTLYLGCRFHGHIDTPVVQEAAKYCDVISYNVYDNTPGDRLNRFVGVVDKPFIVGEFGVSSDPLQTPFRGAQLSVDPNSRRAYLEKYLQNAFNQPLLVGVHFFQFRDQPLTGRTDGEATLRGFVDTTDTQHFDLIQANRRMAYPMYEKRFGQKTAAK